jgi:predicted outer membrane repeat protein
MKRSIILCILLGLVVSIWLLGPDTREARALTVVELTAPGDSSKVTTATPEFHWQAFPPARETVRKLHIKLATDINLTSVIWEDTTLVGVVGSKLYEGPSLTEWQAYYWTMRVQVDSLTMGDTVITYWQEEFARTFTFFYTAATVFHIPSDLPTIQQGIVWAAEGDTVLVEEGTYYENLRFYKKNLLVTGDFWASPNSIDTTVINRTIIDGSQLSRGDDAGSVVYFSSEVDSNSALMGFTIRGGTGTKVGEGADERMSGGGIFCDVGSSPTIAYNVITENQVAHDGGGIYVNSAAPNILHNIITNNSTIFGSGGAIECRFSIEVAASPSRSQGDVEGDQESLSGPKSRLEMGEEEIKNSLNPKDATQVASAATPVSTAKSAQNTPPVAEKTWFARRDTVIERDKYLVDDTLFFDGTGSYDPDYPDDSISSYDWWRNRYYRCERTPSTSFQRMGQESTFSLPITSSETGQLRIYLRVTDTNNGRGFSDTVTIAVQHPPHVDAGDDLAVPPGDTIWLDGSASCDVNPNDILTYTWTQLSGFSVTLQDPDSPTAYFVAEDTTYLGTYEFQLKVSDSMDADSATVQITVSRPPVPLCQDDPTYGDTLVGFFPGDLITLDASASYDPDPGDEVRYFLWQPVARIFISKGDTVELPLSISPRPDSTRAVQTFTYAFGGLLKFRLRARDSYGVRSLSYDSVFYSVQAPAEPEAGQDSILRPGTRAYLEGSAVEINPDQRDNLKYYWTWMKRPSETIEIRPADTLQSVYFDATLSGVYRVELRVFDGFALSQRDSVTVVANQLPTALVQNVPTAFEGDTVLLDASASYDPDSGTFQRPGAPDAGGLKFSWSTRSYPSAAEAPVIVNADRRVAKFVPYGTGTYKFQVLVNDTISKNQPAVEGVNIAVLTVTVDSTYAYPIIFGNLISRNFSGSKGGGIDCNKSSPDIINNIFFKNQSKGSGGGVCCRNLSTPQIKNNIFFGNISSDSTGGGIADLKGQLAPSATRGFRKLLGIQENDFWDNPGGALYETSGNISGNITDFPRLIDPDFGDFRRECSSPCYPDMGSLIYFDPDTCATAERLEMVSLSLFQNPVATAVAHFMVNTDVPLRAPPVAYVTMGGNAPSPVYFTSISPKAYRGSHVFTGSGDAEISGEGHQLHRDLQRAADWGR